MATDSFTNSDGTTLSTHNANWAQGGGYTNNAQINSNQVRNASGFQNVAYYRSDSTSDNCQILKKGNSGMSAIRHSACVRMGASNLGYALRLGTTTGTHDTFTVAKNGTQIGGGNLSSTIADTADYTLRIQAIANGSDQEIRVWVNGVQQTFTFSSGGVNRIDSNLALQDPSANTPLTSGSPGFYNSSSATQADTYWDDWDDLVSGSSIAPLPAILPYYTLLQGG